MTGQHRTRLVGWHPSPAVEAWLASEIRRRGGRLGTQSAILEEAMERAMTARLTDFERGLLASAAEVGPHLRASASNHDRLAGWLLSELAAVITRLDGQDHDTGSTP